MPDIHRLAQTDAALAADLIRVFKKKDVSTDLAERFLGDPANILIAAHVDGRPVGFLLAYALRRVDRDAPMIYVHEIEVLPEHRRRGVGAGLIDSIRQEVEQSEATTCFLITNRSTEGAVAFYTSVGAQMPNGDDLLFLV